MSEQFSNDAPAPTAFDDLVKVCGIFVATAIVAAAGVGLLVGGVFAYAHWAWS